MTENVITRDKTIDDALEQMRRAWPSPVVTRAQVGQFTGGALSPKSLANLDSQGRGPAGRFRMGRATVYRVNEFVEWLRQRCQ